LNHDADLAVSQPEKIILDLYDLGISACDEKNEAKLNKALHTLIDALNFDYAELATSFFNLYNYALTILTEQRFEEVGNILKELRQTWEQVFAPTERASQITQREGLLK